MTQDEIIRMAREAGFHIENWSFGERVSVYESGKTIDITNELKDFAALFAAHIEDQQYALGYLDGMSAGKIEGIEAEREAVLEIVKTIGGEFAVECAAAICARGERRGTDE